jgi:hypothetical protein
MALVLMPDAEQLVIQALLTMDDLDDLEGRIYSAVPKQRTFPLARVYRYGGDPLYDGSPYWIDQPSLQVDVWADGGNIEAQRLGETLRACCAQLVGTWPQGVVDAVRLSSLVQTADPTFDPPKPRYRFTAQLVVHPLRTSTTSGSPGRATKRRAAPAQ